MREDAKKERGEGDGQGVPRANINSDVHAVNDEIDGADYRIDTENDDVAQEEASDENLDGQINETTEDWPKEGEEFEEEGGEKKEDEHEMEGDED